MWKYFLGIFILSVIESFAVSNFVHSIVHYVHINSSKNLYEITASAILMLVVGVFLLVLAIETALYSAKIGVG